MTSGDNIISALGDLTMSSARNIDFKSSSGFFVDSNNLISYSAQGPLYIRSSEESISEVTALAKDRLDVIAEENGFLISDEIIFEIFKRQSVIANTMELQSISSTRIGNEETSNVLFDANTANRITFFLNNDEGEGDSIQMKSSYTEFISPSNSIDVEADNFIGTAGSTFIRAGSDATIDTGDDVFFTATAELGSLDFFSIGGASYSAADDFSISGHSIEFNANTINSNARNGIFLQYDSSITISGSETELTALDDMDISGGRTQLLSDNGVFFGPFTQNPLSMNEVDFFAGENINFYIENDVSIQATDNAYFTSDAGNLYSHVEGDVTFIAGRNTVFDTVFDMFFNIQDTFTISAGELIIFKNTQSSSDDDDFLSFTFATDIVFDANSFDIQVDDSVLFEAGLDINVFYDSPFTVTADNLQISTTSSRFTDSGIFFDTPETIETSSVDTTEFSGFFIDFVAENYDFTAPLITISGSEEIAFASDADIDISINNLIDFDSGHILFNIFDTASFSTTNGPINFRASDSLNMTSGVQTTFETNQDFIGNVGWFKSISGDLDISLGNSLNINAMGSGGSVYFTALDDITFTNTDFISITAPSVTYKASSDQEILSNSGDILVDASYTRIDAHSLTVSLDNSYSINAGGSITYHSEEFLAEISMDSSDNSYSAMNEVHFTSDLNIMNTNNMFTGFGDVSQIRGWDSVEFLTSNNAITFTNSNDANFMSGGATRFFSNDDTVINSASTFYVDAGRVIMDTWNNAGKSALFTANVGNIEFENIWGSILIDSKQSLLLHATNPDTSASTFLTGNSVGVDISADFGTYFNSTGLLNGGNLSFEFKSMGPYGDIVFDSQLGGLQLHTRDEIVYNAGEDINLYSAFGADFVAENSMSFVSSNGLLDLNSQRGITINAGKGLDQADITFTQSTGSFLMTAANQISITSTGAVDNESILFDGKSDIRFHTANTGDISFYANDFLSFDVNGEFSAYSTNNMFIESIAGSISFSSVTNTDFITTGGPIYFTTFSSLPGGEITFNAMDGNIELTSGNSTFLTADQFGSFTSNNGIDFTAIDGSFDVLATAASAFINIISAGGMQITSTGNDVSPDDSIILDSVVNIEFGTVDTTNIAFNAIDSVVVGTYTRPQITFNAGGSNTVFGFKITSDGGIYTETDNQFASSISGNLIVNTNDFITSKSTGTATFTTTGTEGITFTSDTGTVRIHGGAQNVINSNTQIIGDSAGSLQFIGLGANVNDNISWISPSVKLTSATHSWNVQTLDADLTNSFTLTVSEDAIFDGSLDEGSSISFDAFDSFSAVSGFELSMNTQKRNGAILLTTVKNTSDMTLQTQTGSDIEFLAGAELGFFGNQFILTSTSITFDAIHTDPNDDRENGDIQISAENSINASAFETIEILGEQSVLIETTGSDIDDGYDILFTTNGENIITSSESITIRNVPEEEGSLGFSALSDIVISNVDGDGWVSFYSDANLRHTSTRDNELTVDSDYFVRVNENMVLSTQGKDANDDFGISITATNGDFSFEALFGSVEFNAQNDVMITVLDGSVDIRTDRNGRLQGSSLEIVSGEDVVFNSNSASVESHARDGIEFSTPQTFTIETSGVNDNDKYSVYFEGAGNGPFEINSPLIDVNTEGLEFSGRSVTMTTGEFTAAASESDISVEIDSDITLFSAAFDIDAQNIKFEAAVIDINAQENVSFDANSLFIIETIGEDSDIEIFAAGTGSLIATDDVVIKTPRGPNADINFVSQLGRIEIDTGTTPNRDGFGIDFSADFGDFSILGLTDDSDLYISCSQVVMNAGNDVNFISTLTPVTPDVAMILTGSNWEMLSSSGVDVTVTGTTSITTSAGILLEVDDSDDDDDSGGEGGAMVVAATSDITFDANSGITIAAPQEGGRVIISSEDDIVFDSNTVQITAEAVMKIPLNMNENDADPSRTASCRNGDFFWIDETQFIGYNAFNTVGYLCFCDNSTPRCAPFFEPPCDELTDPFCNHEYY